MVDAACEAASLAADWLAPDRQVALRTARRDEPPPPLLTSCTCAAADSWAHPRGTSWAVPPVVAAVRVPSCEPVRAAAAVAAAAPSWLPSTWLGWRLLRPSTERS